MTAVASAPTYQSVPRLAWHTGDGGSQGGLNAMSTEEVSRMFIPRKGAPRPGSSSSMASSVSSTTTIMQPQLHAVQHQNGVVSTPGAGEWDQARLRKKPMRGLWPSAKGDAVSGISTARPQSIKGQPGSASISAIQHSSSALPPTHTSSLQQQPPPAPQQQLQPGLQQVNGVKGGVAVSAQVGDSSAVLYLVPMNGTFDRKTIGVPFFPDVLRIGRQTNAKTTPSQTNGYFDSKVLSRQHAEIWADRQGKIWLRDVKSSNGTFVNGTRLSAENRESEPHELREQDLLELGIDIVSEDQKTVVHHKVSARVEHAGFIGNSTNVMDMNFGDIDPTSGGGMMAPSLPQSMQQNRTGRPSSQGSLNGNGRSIGQAGQGNNMNAVQHQRHANFWLTPVTMEQIVRRLTTELKAAKQQSQDLHRTGEFFDELLSNDRRKESSAASKQGLSEKPQVNGVIAAKMDQKPRFSDPPAPPPRQPLPEAPEKSRAKDAESTSLPHPGLQRSETERSRLPSDDDGPASPKDDQPQQQIMTLVGALASAKRQIESTGARVKSLEEMLQRERCARESAEQRALQLELERQEKLGRNIDGRERSNVDVVRQTAADDTVVRSSEVQKEIAHETDDSFPIHEQDDVLEGNISVGLDSGQRLKKRIDLMVTEMEEMRKTMESYQRRAELAESESASSRKSLAEMVHRIRREDADKVVAEELRRPHGQRRGPTLDRSSSLTIDHQIERLGEPPVARVLDIHALATCDSFASALLVSAGVHDGQSIGPKEIVALERAVSMALSQAHSQGPSTHLSSSSPISQHTRLLQSAPYASILGVVVLGMGVMAMLNGWQKIER